MNNKNLKAIVFSMGLVAAMLTAPPMQAQLIDHRGGHYNGFFQENSQSEGLMRRGGSRSGGSIMGNEAFGAAGGLMGSEPFGAAGSEIGSEPFGAAGSVINNEPFGVPIGGGIGILLAAGMGYAFIQSKKNKQN